jgi:hypothetical protein
MQIVGQVLARRLTPLYLCRFAETADANAKYLDFVPRV